MYLRLVRFTGVTQETVDKVVAQIDESEGPPPGVTAKSMQFVYDSAQGTSLFMMAFDTAEDMAAADEVMGAMDAGDTPGERASVDMGEIIREMQAD